ncbi:hypothetical protein MTR_3g030730 [Medicago truncatula]|uniref:Uncharacterized protein n=1 Tax=Medicago truncatula TaxID=3880 RepID=G7IWT5_MEDTR|nr:hypothetical protein MTR_3g030730 [Medicago truncatula]
MDFEHSSIKLIVHKEVVDGILQFFISEWIFTNYNANTLILIPKSNNADTVEKYMPISMTNFKFKYFLQLDDINLIFIYFINNPKWSTTRIFFLFKGYQAERPLGSLFLCLAEEALSIGITKLVDDGKVKQITGSKNSQFPSHYFKGNFERGISPTRLQNIINLLGFYIDSLPLNYLGEPIFKGIPKASLLSIAGRVQVPKSVVTRMLAHTLSIYSWLISLLKGMENASSTLFGVETHQKGSW